MNLPAALRYAQAGYAVLPVYGLRDGACTCAGGKRCETPGKHPIMKGWERKATTDAKKIEQWFTKWPYAHVGIMPPKGHVICDVDPRNGGDKAIKALMGGKLPKNTPRQRSGGNGWHLVFKGEPAGPLGRGIDIKRHGRGFVVAAPAGHVSGGTYRWEPGCAPWEVEPLELPDALRAGKAVVNGNEFDTLPGTDVEPTKVPLDTVRAALAFVEADEYQRWINVGQALRHNYGDEGEAVWLEWSRTSSKYKDGDEDKWASFDRNRDRPLITVRSIMAMARRAGYRPLASEFEEGIWALADITDAYCNEPPPLEWVIEPCIAAGKVTLLAGAGGSSKSFLALTLACQFAIGEGIGPFIPSGRPGKALLLVSEENKLDVSRRLHPIRRAVQHSEAQGKLITERVGILSVRGLDWRLVYHDEAGDLHETERVQYLIDEVKALGDVRLLVLDPLVAFNGAHENDNMEMARLMFTLDRIAEATGAAVVALHHVSKSGQVTSLNDASQAVVRGASALVDNARAVLLLTRMPRNDAPQYNIAADQAGRYVVARVVKNNYGPHVPDAVFAVEAGGALRYAPEVQRVHATVGQAQRAQAEESRPQELLRALVANPEATQRELAKAAHMSPALVNRVMQELMEEGHVRRVGIGRYPHYEVTKVGRAEAAGEDLSDIL